MSNGVKREILKPISMITLSSRGYEKERLGETSKATAPSLPCHGHVRPCWRTARRVDGCRARRGQGPNWREPVSRLLCQLGEPLGRQDRLFYEFDLEDMVPGDHFLRRIDTALDLSWLRGEMKPHYSHLGCPSVCPELMVRMLLVGYCYSIRSERRLCQEMKVNLAYRWFCGLGLEDKVPDHSTFSVNRHGRFRESDILRKVFDETVCGCMATGLVGGEGFAVDASVIEANASRFQRVEGAQVDWSHEQRASRPVREYLAALESENPPLNPEQKPKAMSPSDPSAAWTTRGSS